MHNIGTWITEELTLSCFSVFLSHHYSVPCQK
jgi:hypothetical protein